MIILCPDDSIFILLLSLGISQVVLYVSLMGFPGLPYLVNQLICCKCMYKWKIYNKQTLKQNIAG